MRRFSSQLVAKRRRHLGLTQEAAAEALGTDVRTYRRYESGEVNKPGFTVRRADTQQLLDRMAKLFRLAPTELVCDDEADFGSPQHIHPLHRAQHFVGREQHMTELRRWAHQAAPAQRVRCIIGAGGAGKSSLAERFVAGLANSMPTATPFVWTFYYGSVDKFFRKLSQRLTGQMNSDLDDLVQCLSNDQAYLLVLDGLEAVQSIGDGELAFGQLTDPALKRLLRHLAGRPTASRALVTSRFQLADLLEWEGGGVITNRLEPLTRPESEAVLRKWGVTDQDLDVVLDRVGGHPLSLAMLGSYVGRFLDGRIPDNLRMEDTTNDPIGRRLTVVLDGYRRALGDVEVRWMGLLVALSPKSSIRAMSRLAWAIGVRTADAPAQAEQAMARLRELDLVFRIEPGVYSAHPFVREFFRDPVTERALATRRRPRAHSSVADADAPTHRSEGLRVLAKSFDRFMEAGLHDEAYQLYQDRLGGFARLGSQLGRWSLGKRLLRTFTTDGTAATLLRGLDREQHSRILYDWLLYADRSGDFEASLKCAAECLRLAETINPILHLRALRALAYTLRLLDRLDEADEAVGRSIAVAQRIDARREWLRSVALGASIMVDRGDQRRASEAFALVRQTGAGLWKRPGLWEAELRIRENSAASLIDDLNQNLRLCLNLRLRSNACYVHLTLADALRTSDTAAAHEHLSAANNWLSRSREVELTLRAHEVAARLAHHSNDSDRVGKEVASGLELATRTNANYFARRLRALPD